MPLTSRSTSESDQSETLHWRSINFNLSGDAPPHGTLQLIVITIYSRGNRSPGSDLTSRGRGGQKPQAHPKKATKHACSLDERMPPMMSRCLDAWLEPIVPHIMTFMSCSNRLVLSPRHDVVTLSGTMRRLRSI